MSFGSRYGYGWAGQQPTDLARMLKAGGKAFTNLKTRLAVDAVAFSGSSGCAIGFHLAVRHNTPLIYVRKQGEKSHGSKVECSYLRELQNYLIVDDFIDSGSTVQLIATRVKEHAHQQKVPVPRCVGILCYDYGTQADQLKSIKLEAQNETVPVFYSKRPKTPA